jgi:hypothetical protein
MNWGQGGMNLGFEQKFEWNPVCSDSVIMDESW